MESNRKLAERLVAVCLDNNIYKRTRSQMVIDTERSIEYHLDDVLKVVRNIQDTSLNKIDAATRFIELENKYGIPKTHLILNND